MASEAPAEESSEPHLGAIRLRAGLVVGPVLTCIGLAWTAIDGSSASAAAVLVGLLTCVVATHRFGRLGPEGSARTSTTPGPL